MTTYIDTAGNLPHEDVTPDPPLTSKMRCNNCGGQMQRSGVNFHATICPRCGMRHDWSGVVTELWGPDPCGGEQMMETEEGNE